MAQTPQPTCPTRRWRRWAGALVGVGLVGVSPLAPQAAWSSPLSIAVQGASDPQTGQATTVLPDFDSQRVDFGHVSNSGMPPRTGARIDEGGTSWYVATVELTVVRNADDSLGVQSVRAPATGRPIRDPQAAVREQPGLASRPPSAPGLLARDVGLAPNPLAVGSNNRAARRSLATRSVTPTTGRMRRDVPNERLEGIYIPSAAQQLADTTTHVDLYVRLDGQDAGGSTVWFSSPQTGGIKSATELLFAETLVATNLPIGQAFPCQVSFKVPPTEWGQQSAQVLFSARPAGT